MIFQDTAMKIQTVTSATPCVQHQPSSSLSVILSVVLMHQTSLRIFACAGPTSGTLHMFVPPTSGPLHMLCVLCSQISYAWLLSSILQVSPSPDSRLEVVPSAFSITSLCSFTAELSSQFKKSFCGLKICAFSCFLPASPIRL